MIRSTIGCWIYQAGISRHAAYYCLQVYIQRLGCDLNNSEAVQQAAGCAFALATEALSDLTLLQFPPSLIAAALLMSARKHQVKSLPKPTLLGDR